MGVTISTHNGSAVARDHNVRNPKVVSKEPHIDPNGIHETWIDVPVRQAYDRLFGQAVAEYNATQSRPERRISSYYNEICKDKKKHPVYEMIIGIYGKNEDGSPICSAEQGKKIMREFVSTWKQRNPNLILIGAYYHADEAGEPHLHLDYIPIAHGYTRGLKTQSGLVRAFEEQGLVKKGKDTAQILWEKQENAHLTALCEAVGLTVDHPLIEGRTHLDTQNFKLQAQAEQLKQEVSRKKAELQEITEQKATDDEIKRFQADEKAIPFSKRVSVDKELLDKVVALARQGLSEQQKNSELMRTTVPLETHKSKLKELNDEISSIKAKSNRIEQAIRNLSLVPTINEEYARILKQEQSRSSEREQQTQQKKKSSPKR